MNRKLMKVRTKLLLTNPFFGTLALKLKMMAEGTETMATDGYHLFFSEQFVEDTPYDELVGVFCHEILHCAMLHMFRRGDRNHKKWNAACDYVINDLLINEFEMQLPKDGLLDPRYTGLAEDVYRKLPDMPELPAWGQFMDGISSPEAEAEWKIAVKQAAEAAKAAGQDIGRMKEFIEIAEAKVNWREQLARLIGGMSKADFSWMKPNTRFLQHNMVIPTLNTPSVGHLTLAFDTSVSVSNEELGQFIGEVQHLLENVHYEGITVLECDTQIANITELDPGDEISCEVHGRGGTYFAPVFNYIKNHPTNALIYFTDMEPYDPFPAAPEIPVYWARTTNKNAPYGEYIDLFRG